MTNRPADASYSVSAISAVGVVVARAVKHTLLKSSKLNIYIIKPAATSYVDPSRMICHKTGVNLG